MAATEPERSSPAGDRGLADRAELGDLVAAYALAMDHRSAGELSGLFTPGGAIWVPAGLNPGAGDRAGGELTRLEPAQALATLTPFTRTRHVVSQSLFAVDGDTAGGETYGSAHHLYERHGELRDRALALRYLDTFARTSQGWRFERRELVVDWLTDEPVRLLR